MKYLGHSYTKNSYCLSENQYLLYSGTRTLLGFPLDTKKFWVFCILSGNPKYEKKKKGNWGWRKRGNKKINIPYPDPSQRKITDFLLWAWEPVQILRLDMSFLMWDHTRVDSKRVRVSHACFLKRKPCWDPWMLTGLERLSGSHGSSSDSRRSHFKK